MKRLSVMVLSIMLLTGCGDSLYDESMKQGKLAMANGEFAKAKASFELALDEKPDDPEASGVYEQLVVYENVQKEIENGQWDEALTKVEALKKAQNIEKSLKQSFDELVNMAENGKENERVVSEKVETIKGLVSEKNYEAAQKLIDEMKQSEQLKVAYQLFSNEVDQVSSEIQSGIQQQAEAEKEVAVREAEAVKRKAENESRKVEYYSKLDQIEMGMADLEYIYEQGTTVEVREAESERYKRWDDALNEIYGVLKKQLPSNEMEQLRKAQRKWVTYRDESAESAAASYEGGSWASVQYVSTQAELTKQRCYELVDRYMK
ncbi:lysozyme inhibitor LprI family protein [Bacillus sp. FJAT-42315]|uniref:lysozyme inhibitor LprI family protein n=1 Tax=Bacillus sp. FJAT-42315 TaxID=2014077 RepID=UPI000C23FDC7|nr:lysozyme inhibitor LprI family protein [Bacillus sp. FJAT-42315]